MYPTCEVLETALIGSHIVVITAELGDLGYRNIEVLVLVLALAALALVLVLVILYLDFPSVISSISYHKGQGGFVRAGAGHVDVS